MKRCGWTGASPLMVEYHDREWGVPLREDQRLFELLTLEGAQAGLSWSTILNKRENYRLAFEGFEPVRVAEFNDRKVDELLGDAGIVRHRGKIESTIANAGRVLEVQSEIGSFTEYVWSFVGGEPIVNDRQALADLPAETAESRAMSRDMRRWGFRFAGPITCYSFMQAAGLVNDHTVDCFRYAEIRSA